MLTGSYTYDPLNRRVHKQVSDGSQVTATAYVYDGWRCIEEWEATWPVGSQPPSPTYTLAAQYIHGGYIDEVLVMRRDVDDNGSLEEYFYHADDQFNIVAVTNASGAVVERYEYGPFGAPTILDPSGAVREESAIGNANLWNGREYDAETGLYYYRLRYLDPELGRFTTLDPIGLWGDPNNLGNGYAYVGNRPWTGLDPYGLYGANAWHSAYLAGRMQHGETLVDLSSPRFRGTVRVIGGTIGTALTLTALTGEGVVEGASLGAATPVALPAAALTSAGLVYSLDNVFTGLHEVRDNQAYDLQTTRAIAALTNPEFARNAEIAFDLVGGAKGLWHLASWARAMAKNADDLTASGARCLDNVPDGVGKYETGFIGTKVRWGKQRLHLEGSKELDGFRGYMRSSDEAQGVLDAFHSGRARIIEIDVKNNRVIAEVPGFSGVHRAKSGTIIEESSVFIIKGSPSNGASVVPTDPRLALGVNQ